MPYQPQAEKEYFMMAIRKLNYASAASLPLHFKLGDRDVRGIPEDFNPKTSTSFLDANIVRTEIIGEKDGLEIRAEVLEYRDFPTVEYTVWFTNRGKKATAVLSEINALEHEFCGENPVLVHGTGDTWNTEGYKFARTPITAQGYTLAPEDTGLSCTGAYPFMRLCFADQILTCAIGWSGTWKADFRATPLGVVMTAGQKYTAFKILPGETMRTPRICLQVTLGDETRAMNTWRRFFRAHVMPRQWGKPVPSKLCMHVHGYNGCEHTGGTEDNQLFGLHKYMERGIKPDLWWYDAGFYTCKEPTWVNVGTWKEDPVRWPHNGLGILGEECAKNGIDFMLWFEPERVARGTELDLEHHDFLLTFKNAKPDEWMLLNLGNSAARNWMIERVDALIKKWHITVYRQDCNFNHYLYWRDNEAPDRLGALENLAVQGYYAYWDALLLRNPGLIIDSCAGGGRRNDLETLRRAVVFHPTDVGLYDPAQRQKQQLALFEWAPYFRQHAMNDDDGNMHDASQWLHALTPAVTMSAPCWMKEETFALARKMIPVWRRAADLELSGDYYPQMQTIYDAELTTFFCTHFYDPDTDEGFVLFIRNGDCEQDAFTAHTALRESTTYRVENPVTGETYTKTGAELATFTQALQKNEAALWFFAPVGKA